MTCRPSPDRILRRMRRNSRCATVALGVALLAGVGGCGTATATPPACDSFAASQNTVSHLGDVNVSENGLAAIQPYLTQLRDQLNQLYTDAKTKFAPQAD